jgi:hypothetical protein
MPRAIPAPERRPVFLTNVGRQRVVKTTLLNAVGEVDGKAGAGIEVWNADLHNCTRTGRPPLRPQLRYQATKDRSPLENASSCAQRCALLGAVGLAGADHV